jgi:hypothetical protein
MEHDMSDTVPTPTTHQDVLAGIRARLDGLLAHVEAEMAAIRTDLESVPERVKADAERLWAELRAKL